MRSSASKNVESMVCAEKTGPSATLFRGGFTNKHCLLANVFVAVAGICGIPPLAAQTPASTGIPVHTVVTVESRHGSTPPDINREEVLVHEGKERDTVTEWVP